MRALTLLLCLFLAPPAFAEAPTRLYRAAWGGFHVGDLTFTFDDSGDRYATRFVLDAQGAARWLFKLNLEAGSEGIDRQQGKQPTLWSFRTISPQADRMLQAQFDPATRTATGVRDVVLRTFAKDADFDPPPPVPAALKKDVLDPLTALFQMQDRIRQGQIRFVLPVFDGRRRFDLDFLVLGPSRKNVLGREYDTLELSISFKPIAGWRDRHMKMWKDALFEMSLDRKELLPVKITTDHFIAAMVISYAGDCRTGLACPARIGLEQALLDTPGARQID